MVLSTYKAPGPESLVRTLVAEYQIDQDKSWFALATFLSLQGTSDFLEHEGDSDGQHGQGSSDASATDVAVNVELGADHQRGHRNQDEGATDTRETHQEEHIQGALEPVQALAFRSTTTS